MGLDRRLFPVAAAVVIALLAVPAVALARTAYVTGEAFEQALDEEFGYAEPVNLITQEAGAKTKFFGGEGPPSAVAITPDGSTAYVAVSPIGSGAGIVPIDVATNVAGPVIETGSEPGLEPGPEPHAIAITPDGKSAYVVNRAEEAVVEVDLASRTVVGKTKLAGLEPDAIAITPDGKSAYVADFKEAVSVIDLATGTVVETIAIGKGATGIAVTPDGANVYVACGEGQSVWRIEVASGTATEIPTGSGVEAIAITPDGSRAYALSVFGNAVDPIELGTNKPGTPIPFPGFPAGIAILPDGSRAYITGESFVDPSMLVPLNLSDETLEAGFYVGERPEAIAIVPNQPPHAAFTSSPAAPAPESTVSFNAGASTDSDGTVVRYEWEFGDGATATTSAPNVTHSYAKAGTYQVTVTETDNEGCSTKLVFTGQTAYCNGSSVARATHPVTVASTGPAATSTTQPGEHHHTHHRDCVALKVEASSFVPKRRPGHVVPGVRVRVAPSVPGKVTIAATLLRQQGDVSLGKTTVEVRHWRRMRFVLPPTLRGELPYGTPVKVSVATTLRPKKPHTCEQKQLQRPTVLELHVVRVFPHAVQFHRGR